MARLDAKDRGLFFLPDPRGRFDGYWFTRKKNPDGSLARDDAGHYIEERHTGKGTWGICFFDEQGRRHRPVIGSKSDATKAYQKVKSDIRAGIWLPPKKAIADQKAKPTLVELCERLMDSYKDPGGDKPTRGMFSPGAYPAFMARLREEFGTAKHDEVTAEALIEWRMSLVTEEELRPSYANKYTAMVGRAYSRAIELKLLPKGTENPAAEIGKLPLVDRVIWLHEELGEDRRLLDAIPTLTERLLVLFAMREGPRRAELFDIQWPNLHLGPSAHVRIVRQGMDGRVTKTRAGRIVPIFDEDLRRLLLEHRARLAQRAALIRAQDPSYPHDLFGWPWVFPSPTGCRMDGGNFATRVWYPALDQAGLRGRFHFHDLRHHFAVSMRRRGCELADLRDWLGHKTIAMTELYSKYGPAQGAEKVARLLPVIGTTLPLQNQEAEALLATVQARMTHLADPTTGSSSGSCPPDVNSDESGTSGRGSEQNRGHEIQVSENAVSEAP